MRICRYIVSLVLCTLSLCTWSQDYARLSERTIMGTARYVGMCGAMSAIGGDPSAVVDNVAGLGLYRHFEVMLSLDYETNKTFMAPHASTVFSLRTDNPTEQGILYHNFMLGYHRIHCFNGSVNVLTDKAPSLGALFALAEGDLKIPFTYDRFAASTQLKIQERGYINEYTFDWSMNISNRWYVGAGLRIHSYSMSSEGDYLEKFQRQNMDLIKHYNYSHTKLLLNGADCAFAAGLIVRPASWMRFALGIETPSFGALSIGSSGEFAAMTDSLRWAPDAPDIVSEVSDFHMPFHLSTSVAFQVSRYALIALQYDYRTIKDVPSNHSLRAGVEVVPVAGLYLNAGYAFESAFKRSFDAVPIDPTLDRQDAYFMYPQRQHYISGGVGFRGRRFLIQAAYQYHMKRSYLCAHLDADPSFITNNTHRVVLTIGWHSY